MKVLLLNSPWINNDKVYGIKSGTRWPELRSKDRTMPYFPFPYEMACAAQYLKKAGIDAHMKDAIAEEMTADACLTFIENFKPALTLIEVFPPSLRVDLAFAGDAKKRTGTRIAFCGAHPDALPKEVLENPQVDYVLFGEYEEALRDLSIALEAGRDNLDSITGLAYKKDGEIRINARRAPIANVDEIPWPDLSELPVYKYTEPLSKHSPNARVMTTRGCPYSCPFCIVPMMHGHAYRKRSLPLVMEEIRVLKEKWGIRDICFDDAFFTIPRAKELAEALIQADLKIGWSSWMDWGLSPEEALLLKKSGCYALKFGIESSNSEIMKSIGKPVYLNKLRGNIHEFKRLGLMVHGSFILGMPGETRQSLKETIDMIFSLELSACQASVATPLPGTAFYDMVIKNGWLVTDDWSQFEGTMTPVISYPSCSRQDLAEALAEVKRRKVRLFLKNPKNVFIYIWKLFRHLGFRGFCGDVAKKGRYVLRVLTGKK